MKFASSMPHDAARQHVNGSARYVDDIPIPNGTLHLAFGLSSVAAGTITSVDLSAVRAAHGVHLVIEARDLPFANDVSPSAHDEPLLANATVHYAGQPIFLVVAESHHDARRAARLAKIKIVEIPAILTIQQALTADSRFEDGPRIYAKGDIYQALPKAKNRLSGSINVGGQEHFYLEGQAALAMPGDNDDMVVHSSTQHPTEIQHKVAEALNISQHAVRIEVRRMGGGFGGKESQGNALAVACAVAASITGHPCKMRYDRDDDFIITGKRHDCRVDYRVGFNASRPGGGLRLHSLFSLRMGTRFVTTSCRSRHAACRQCLQPTQCTNHLTSIENQYAKRHSVSRLRWPAGHDWDRKGDGPYST